jgi:hypothetical protein
MLDALQRDAFRYFLNETNPANGLVVDKTQPGAPSSIAAIGFALAAYPVGVERSWMTRTEAAKRTLAVLRFFWTSPQGTTPGATGYKGFYYHFLDMKTGRRSGRCELSTIDTAFLLAGMLVAVYPEITGKYCFKCSFNLTFQHESQGKPGWTSLYHYGINLGPVVLMCENYRSGLLWRLTRRCPYLVTGLRRAGFANGWL